MTDEDTHSTNPSENMASPYGTLHTAFGAQELQARDRFYDHDSSKKLLEQLKDDLAKSETGDRLLQVLEHLGAKVKFIKSKKLQSSVNGTNEVFLSATPDQQKANLSQLIEFGGALRELEQNAVGYGMPSMDEDPFEKASRIHTKYLDKIVFMCKIGHELESIYGNQIREVLSDFGYIDIYNAHVDNAGHEAVGQIYRQAQEET